MLKNILAAGLLWVGCAGMAIPGSAQDIDIPYEVFELSNGLTLIVHEDHKAPIVAVNVWYHVGSKNEKPGKTGFAHLFEHLMFNGSEHYNDDWFKAVYRVGGTGVNGTTNFDRTNYFQNVPVTALDTMLFLESDRMGHLLSAIDQDRLDEQRGVVQNEKRQGENQPYGKVWNVAFRNLFPEGHPYSWLPIGSMEDLEAASLDDVHQWFGDYYGPDKAVIVVAGDIDAATARAKVEEYFGDIPAGPPLARPQRWVPRRTGTQRVVMQDRVPQARVYRAWIMPEWGSEEADFLQLAGDVLGSGKNSRLFERLVYRDQIATDVSAFAFPLEIAGVFGMIVTAQPGQDLGAIESAMDEELARFLKAGPTRKELQRVKSARRASFVRGIERVGGFGGKSDVLAENQVYGGRPDFYKTTMQRIMDGTAEDVRGAAAEWLGDGDLILEVLPFQEFARSEKDVDRSALPQPDGFPEVGFADFEKGELGNGMKIVVASRPTIPVVNFTLLVDSGYAADQFGLPGTASLAMAMLDEGTTKRDALEISEELAMLGATLGAGSNLDMSSVSLSALKDKLDPSLEIYADVVLRPSFPDKELERLRKERLAQIQREKVSPVPMALRVYPGLLYGKGHAYAQPFTGSGTEESVRQLTRKNIEAFHQDWFKADNATMIVVGDTILAEIQPKLEKYFGGWRGGDVPEKNIATVAARTVPSVYIVDRPGSQQSIIFAGQLAPPRANAENLATETANDVLGGDFTSRINLNLREDKHWSYGARSVVVDAKGQQPFFVYAPVQSDKTIESMIEIRNELTGLVGDRPPTEEEILDVIAETVRGLPGRWETNAAVASALVEIERFGLPEDYWDRYAAALNALGTQAVAAAAHNLVDPGGLVWVVVGDRASIEAGIRELDLGELHFIDADGNPVAGDAGVSAGAAP